MTDFEHRNQHHRGSRGRYRGGRGGGGGGRDGTGNFRKRRYQDDDDHDDRRHQRRRYEEPPHIKLRSRLLTLAEAPSRGVEDEISELARLIHSHAEEEELKRVFLSIPLQLVQEQPLKIPFIGGLILSVNSQNYDLAAEFLKHCGECLENHIASGSWREAKLVLRLFACLQPLFEEDGVFPILEELFDRAGALQSASSEDGLGLELVKIVLLTMAYAMAVESSGFEAAANALLEKTDIVASMPHVLENLSNPFFTTEADPRVKSTIGLLQQQMQYESKNDWHLKCIPRAWHAHGALEATESKHPFPAIDIPVTLTTTSRPMLPEVYFSIYFDSEVETVPPLENIASSIMRDAIVDTINILDFNRNAAAKCLIDLDCYYPRGTFVPRATPFDKLRETSGEGSTWKTEDVAVDAVFSQLMKLPLPEHKEVYYHALLTELCKIAPAAIAPSLGRAIRFLYSDLEKTDLELNYRFMDWFTHHLSNFGFTWKWTEWVDDAALSSTHIRKAFITGSLEKEIRLSVAQRIRGTLPEPYHPLVGPEKDKEIPDFKYGDETYPYSTETRELVRLIKAKAPDVEIEAQLSKIQDAVVDVEGRDPLTHSLEAYVTSLCFVGSTSLSHVLSCIDRHKDRLLKMAGVEKSARFKIISSVLDYWKTKPGNGISIIDKLLNYTILTPHDVVEWVFVHHLRTGHTLTEPHMYEMIRNTLFKVTHRLRQLVIARLEPGQAPMQVDALEASITKEMASMKAMFTTLEDAAQGVAEGSADGLLDGEGTRLQENTDGYERPADEVARLRQWGAKWHRTFTRQLAIEDAWTRESLAFKPPAAKEVDMADELQDTTDPGNTTASATVGVDASMTMAGQ